MYMLDDCTCNTQLQNDCSKTMLIDHACHYLENL